MTSQKTGLKRDSTTHDKFYTKKEIAKSCIEAVSDIFDCKSFDIVIEPAAGNGSFSLLLPEYFDKKIVIAYDIEPEHESITRQNFLELSQEQIRCFGEKKTLVISNVPFGRQSTLAKQFIKQSCKFATVIAFVLPKSFKKYSMQKCFHLKWHKVFEKDLSENSFLVNGKDYDVPCIFQVWQKQETIRESPDLVLPTGFAFVKKENEHDMIFRRVGVNAGKCHSNQNTEFSEQSHYFIKFDESLNPSQKNSIVELLNDYAWEFDNHVGPKSIGKQELIPVLNTIIQTVQ